MSQDRRNNSGNNQVPSNPRDNRVKTGVGRYVEPDSRQTSVSHGGRDTIYTVFHNSQVTTNANSNRSSSVNIPIPGTPGIRSKSPPTKDPKIP